MPLLQAFMRFRGVTQVQGSGDWDLQLLQSLNRQAKVFELPDAWNSVIWDDADSGPPPWRRLNSVRVSHPAAGPDEGETALQRITAGQRKHCRESVRSERERGRL